MHAYTSQRRLMRLLRACRTYPPSCRAFEKLAHPVYGVMGIDYRPVDCFSGAALQREPGYISRDVIYEDETKPGWEW